MRWDLSQGVSFFAASIIHPVLGRNGPKEIEMLSLYYLHPTFDDNNLGAFAIL
jgi:hypothetical protein